jgi:hypothetical protein
MYRRKSKSANAEDKYRDDEDVRTPNVENVSQYLADADDLSTILMMRTFNPHARSTLARSSPPPNKLTTLVHPRRQTCSDLPSNQTKIMPMPALAHVCALACLHACMYHILVARHSTSLWKTAPGDKHRRVHRKELHTHPFDPNPSSTASQVGVHGCHNIVWCVCTMPCVMYVVLCVCMHCVVCAYDGRL